MAAMKYISLLAAELLAKVINYPLAPVAVLFASEDGWLPKWLSYLGTPDNSLDGDEGWKTEHRQFKVEDSKFKQWVNRTAWLYRNSMYGFSQSVLGVTIQPGFTYSVSGDELVSNRPLHNGLVNRKLVSGGKEYWQWYYVRAWSDTKCIRINFGWKLWGDLHTGKQCAFVFSVNQFMGYSKV